jgi:hypothetical protein
MYDSVRAAWRPWNTSFEGIVYWMYLDTHDPPLVTTGMGNLIDPIALALPLAWQKPDGTDASQDEISAEWQAVKQNIALSSAGAGAAGRATQLRLDDAAIDTLIGERLDQNIATLKRHAAFSAFETWPADAQLGLLSMAWAMGAGFGQNFPRFSASVAALDFTTAATQCTMQGSPAPVRRNNATQLAFQLAAQAVASGRDLSVLSSPVTPA